MSQLALLASVFAHIGVLILAATELPMLHDPPDPFEDEIRIPALLVSERTEAKAPLPPEPLPVETPPEPPEPEPVVAEPPPVEASPPPEKPVEVAAPEPPKPEPPPEEPVEVAALTPEPQKPEPPPEPEPPAAAPEPPPPPQKQPPEQTQAKPPPKPPEPAPKPAPAPKLPPNELAALREATRADDLDTLRSALPDKPPTPTPAEVAEEAVFTQSHKARIRRQLKSCWQPVPGLDPSENYAVKLQVTLGPDRRIISIKPVGARSSRSYRAGREWAERALRHPLCEQLDVPPGWTSLDLNFDPRKLQ